MTSRRFRPSLAGLPSRLTPSGSVLGPVAVAMAAPAPAPGTWAQPGLAAPSSDPAAVSGGGACGVAIDPAAVDSLPDGRPSPAGSSAPAATAWSGPMMPSDDDFDLTPWTLAEMAPPADFPV